MSTAYVFQASLALFEDDAAEDAFRIDIAIAWLALYAEEDGSR